MPILSTKGAASASGFGGIGKGPGGGAILYEFTSNTFTNATAEGMTGPTLSQCQSAYSGQAFLSENFTTSNGIQIWTIPGTGTYRFDINGAAGGYPQQGSASQGHWGARIQMDIVLQSGQQIAMAVGQKGSQTSGSQYNAGGGGGTFVYDYPTNTLYGVAGGGAGSCSHGSPNPNYAYTGHASLTESGNPGTRENATTSSWPPPSDSGGGDSSAVGGTGGNMGTALNSSTGSTNCAGAPGGGWFTSTQYRWSQSCSYSNSAVQNGVGRGGNFKGGAGMQSSNTLNGGFGGGGGGSGCCGGQGSGGGGGYSGGAGSADQCCGSIGGGGGSYTHSSATNVSSSHKQSQTHGFVTVEFLG